MFEETLYLDIDTVVLNRLDFGFEMARKQNLACCICECPWARRYASIQGTSWNTTPAFFFTKKATPLFDRWITLAR
jgi:hypothetical protein